MASNQGFVHLSIDKHGFLMPLEIEKEAVIKGFLFKTAS